MILRNSLPWGHLVPNDMGSGYILGSDDTTKVMLHMDLLPSNFLTKFMSLIWACAICRNVDDAILVLETTAHIDQKETLIYLQKSLDPASSDASREVEHDPRQVGIVTFGQISSDSPCTDYNFE